MGRSHHLAPTFRRPRRRRRWLLLVLVLGLALLGGYVYLTRPQRLIRLANELLASMTRAEVQVRDAEFDLDGTIHLTGVSLRVPGIAGEAGKLFEVGQVEIAHDLSALIGGHFRPRALTFTRPTLYLTRLTAAGKFNYQFLQTRPEQPFPGPERLPEMAIRGGRISFAEFENQTIMPLGELRLFGTLTEDPRQAGLYRYRLNQEQSDGGVGPALSGTFDLLKLTLTGKLERFMFDRREGNVLSGRLRQWWVRLDPVGELPPVQFGYDPDPAIGVHAVFDVSNVQLNPFPDVPARMRVTSGRFTVSSKTIRIADLAGRIEGFAYTINGEIRGFSEDAPFNLTARISGALPDEPRFLPGLPEKVQRTFNQFTPTGALEAVVELNRDQAGGGLTSYKGRATISQGKTRYARFPYPLEDVHGQFVFDDQVLRVVAMRGRGPSGARATLSGTFTPPGSQARVELVNGRIVDVINGRYCDAGTSIILHGGKIESIRSRPRPTGEPADVTPDFSIDMQGKTVLRGLFNTHIHGPESTPTFVPGLRDMLRAKRHHDLQGRDQTTRNSARYGRPTGRMRWAGGMWARPG